MIFYRGKRLWRRIGVFAYICLAAVGGMAFASAMTVYGQGWLWGVAVFAVQLAAARIGGALDESSL